jgi:CCR4-NOT transcription complex subunit 2
LPEALAKIREYVFRFLFPPHALKQIHSRCSEAHSSNTSILQNPNYATKLAAAQSASSSAWPSQQNPSNSSSSAPPLAPPPSSSQSQSQQLLSLASSQQQQQSNTQQSRQQQQSYPPNLTNGSVPLQQPPPNSSSNGGPYLDHQAVGGAGVGPDGSSAGGAGVAGGVGGSLPSQTIPAQQILSSPADKWGLQAFLHAIRNADEDKGMLSFGTDLMSLGMDMGSQESVSLVHASLSTTRPSIS